MLTSRPTSEQIAHWKEIARENRPRLKPCRRTGAEVETYFRGKYDWESYPDSRFMEVVRYNILENEYSREKLPSGRMPDIAGYRTKDGVLVGIDRVTGFLHVECENMELAARVHDDLFVYRGLDERDLDNFFLIAQYVECGAQGSR